MVKWMLVLSVFFSSVGENELKILSNWKLQKKYEGIKVETRWVYYRNKIKVRQMKVSFESKSNSKDFIKNLSNEKSLLNWGIRTKKCQVIPISEEEWITYTLYDIPYPFSNQDLITKYKLINSLDTILISVNSVPQYLKKIKGINRQQHYYGEWKIIEQKTGNLKIEFSSI